MQAEECNDGIVLVVRRVTMTEGHVIYPPNIKDAAISNTPKTILDYSAKEAKVLYQVSSIFPLDPFPTTISVQPSTISIVHNLFNISKNLMTINMDDVFTVEVEAGLFFATLKIQQKQATLPVIELPYFWKSNAMQARRIIQGLLIVKAKQLEIPNMKTNDVIPYLEEIGSTHVVM